MPACARTIASSSIFLLLAASFLLAPPAWGQNENEEIGFSSNHIFAGDYFGENLDVLNGNLVLSIPLGPKFRVSAGLEYQLVLSYNSKVWLEKNIGDATDEALMASTRKIDWDSQPSKQIHNAGLGFRLSLGRIFYVKKHPLLSDLGQGEAALDPGWYYQDPVGTTHPLVYCPELKDSSFNGIHDFERSEPPDPKPNCPFDGSANHYETSDSTFMRAAKIFNANNEHTGWYLWPGDGTKHTFKYNAAFLQNHNPANLRDPVTQKLDPKRDTDSQEVRGFHLTRIEGVEKYVAVDANGNKIVLPYNYIDITHDQPPKEHLILRIDEYRVSYLAGTNPGLPSRTILFTNVSELAAAPSCIGAVGTRDVSIHGGLVSSVSLPSFGGSRAVYDFEYCIADVSVPLSMQTCSGTQCSDPNFRRYSSVPMLQRFQFPATGPAGAREMMQFDYTDAIAPTGTHGELTERQLPTGARIRYEYGYYKYGMLYLSVASGKKKGASGLISGCKCTDTRQIVRKLAFESPVDTIPDAWEYDRNGDLPSVGSSQGISRNPTRVVVKDPEGNETVYHYWSEDSWSPTNDYLGFLNGLNFRTETYSGRWSTGSGQLSTGKLIRVEHSRHARKGTYSPAVRSNIQRVEREVEFADDGSTSGRHRRRHEAWTFDFLGNEISHQERDIDSGGHILASRKSLRTWKSRSELSGFERENWIIHLLQEEQRFDGIDKLEGRTIYTLTGEGRVRAELRLARPDAGPAAREDLQTVYCFEGDDLVNRTPNFPPIRKLIFPPLQG